MTVNAGTRFGSYEVLALLGAGGMGEVYRARDTKLGRDVAIKVLPEAVAHDPERLFRFEREARMLASLNHPNIATIYGFERTNGTGYLVMELVSGETLAERIKRDGALPLEEALTIAREIAEALEAAHEKGIIHRDLKPANVRVTPDGKVKILDFGLAKAFGGDTIDSNPSQSPTLSAAATMQGIILGTAAYMSPEQARGKLVDKRTDIWAFGCVLYELLTAKAAFEGETVTEILAAVLKNEPNWDSLPATTPSSIRTLLRRCLQKDKNLRLHDAGDARIEIHEALTSPRTSERVRNAKFNRVFGWLPLTVIGIALLLGAAIAILATWSLRRSPSAAPPLVSRFTITLPETQQLVLGPEGPALALSPDGTQLAYVAAQGSGQQLYLRSIDSLEPRAIPETDGAFNPFFSPDGKWIGFFSRGLLKKIPAAGGAALTLANATNPHGVSWGPNVIVFAPTNPGALHLIPDAGGAPQQLTHLDKGETVQRWPEFLPGGGTLLFSGTSGGVDPINAQVAIYSVKTGERHDLTTGTNPHYASSGHLLYAQDGNIMAVPFDVSKAAITGSPTPVVEGVAQSIISGVTQYSVSANGTLAYIAGPTQAAPRKMVWVDRHGQEQPLPAPARAYRYPRLSPDGSRVAVTIEGSESHIWIYELARETLSRFTFEGRINLMGAWTPDGKRIAFSSSRLGPQNPYWQSSDGSGAAERISSSEFTTVLGSMPLNGQALAAVEVRQDTGYDIVVFNFVDHKLEPFLHTRFNEGGPAFCPDGRWIAYMSDESGRPEIYVQPYPGPGGKWQISAEGGTEPVWNPNGRELFYRNGEKMMAVDVATGTNFSAGKPKLLFEGAYVPSPANFPNYNVSRDGQRFLMIKAAEQAERATQINIVLNWFEELKQKVPVGKKQ